MIYKKMCSSIKKKAMKSEKNAHLRDKICEHRKMSHLETKWVLSETLFPITYSAGDIFVDRLNSDNLHNPYVSRYYDVNIVYYAYYCDVIKF